MSLTSAGYIGAGSGFGFGFALFLLSMALFLVIRPLNNPQKRNYQLIFIMLSSFISRKIESI